MKSVEYKPDSASFPAAPWRLRGWGIATVGRVDAAVARGFVPPSVTVVEVWPGTTLGGTVFASYEAGSTLVYRELNLVAALVRAKRRVGFWLPQLYVDSAASREGGRRIWGLPKDLARFTLTECGSERLVDVSSDDGASYSVAGAVPALRLPLWAPVPFLSMRDGAVCATLGTIRATFAPSRVRVEAASDAYRALGLKRVGFGLHLHAFAMTIPAPRAT